jgi:hypothetical protein
MNMTAPNIPDWAEYLFGGGVLSSLAGLLGWHSGRRRDSAIADANEAGARKSKLETLDLTKKESASFEEALNERALAVITTLQRHVDELTVEVQALRKETASLREELNQERKHRLSVSFPEA